MVSTNQFFHNKKKEFAINRYSIDKYFLKKAAKHKFIITALVPPFAKRTVNSILRIRYRIINHSCN